MTQQETWRDLFAELLAETGGATTRAEQTAAERRLGIRRAQARKRG